MVVVHIGALDQVRALVVRIVRAAHLAVLGALIVRVVPAVVQEVLIAVAVDVKDISASSSARIEQRSSKA